MSWTEPSCRCGGTGADGCRPVEAALAIGIDQLSAAIARDLANRRTVRSLVRQDLAASDTGVVEAAPSPAPNASTLDRNHTDQPALPASGMSDAEWERLMNIMKEEGLA